MYNKLYISKINEVYAHVKCESSDAMELNEYFTFYVPGYKFMPAFRNKVWDGKIRLFNSQTRQLYYGLLPHLEKFAEERDYKIEYDESVEPADEFSYNDAQEFIDTLGLPFAPRDYQIKAFVHAVRNKRAMLLSPTASGKSLIIYLLARWFNTKTLIIVPTISLVAQLYKDFEDYGFESDKYIHQIMAGADKKTDCPIVISTWQSIYKMPKEWFEQFEVVVGDEAHLFKAKSLTTILTNLTDCK